MNKRSYSKRKKTSPTFFVDMYQLACATNLRKQDTTMSLKLEEALQTKLDRMGFFPLDMKQTITLKSASRKNKNKGGVTLPPRFVHQLEVNLGMMNVVHCG